MSHVSGNYTYNFVRLDPTWDNSAETGIQSLVVGLTCAFTGVDSQGNEVNVSQYVDGSTGFSPYITYDYLTGNIEDIANEYASGQNWWYTLRDNVSGRVDHPVPVSNFPYPHSGEPHAHPPADATDYNEDHDA
mgnify:CR=1 FL=1